MNALKTTLMSFCIDICESIGGGSAVAAVAFAVLCSHLRSDDG